MFDLKLKNIRLAYLFFICVVIDLIPNNSKNCFAHEIRDFDDLTLYKVDFSRPNVARQDLMKSITVYTDRVEEYNCVIPEKIKLKEDSQASETNITSFDLIRPNFSATICSYRIEAYWTYEICHGYHVRQYHEEREGKITKLQEFYLGKWSEEKTESLLKRHEEDRNSKIKHKTIKIDDMKYPYFEMEMTDGTLCDIINETRSIKLRYVCHPHGKNEIYSFKEVSSCIYEAIILTSALCKNPVFRVEESTEIVIKCFNSLSHKPLSMLQQELNELQLPDSAILMLKESPSAVSTPEAIGDRLIFTNDLNVYRLVEHLTNDPSTLMVNAEPSTDITTQIAARKKMHFQIKELILRRKCLIGGTGWWKFEFCHNEHIRQFHKDIESGPLITFGTFNEEIHRQWINKNPDKAFKKSISKEIWHHYESGTWCSFTKKPREVDVKFTCILVQDNELIDSVYLLEPRTCHYILVVESSIVCKIMDISNEYGLADIEKIEEVIHGSDEGNIDNQILAESEEKGSNS